MPEESPYTSFNRSLFFEEGNNEIFKDFQRDIAQQPNITIQNFTQLRAELLPPSAILPRFERSSLTPHDWNERMCDLRQRLSQTVASTNQSVVARIVGLAARRLKIMVDLEDPRLTEEFTYIREAFSIRTTPAAPSIRVAACTDPNKYAHRYERAVQSAFVQHLLGREVLLQPVAIAPELPYVWVRPSPQVGGT